VSIDEAACSIKLRSGLLPEELRNANFGLRIAEQLCLGGNFPVSFRIPQSAFRNALVPHRTRE
jgi:hypothetical protein